MSRSMAPNTKAPDQHWKPLLEIIRVAPNGFPSQADIRAALLGLHEKYRIVDCETRFAFRVMEEAADSWRIMTKHVVQLARGTKVAVFLIF